MPDASIDPDRPLAALLFDFDGVIANSEPLHCQSYLETAAEMDVPLTRERYFRELIGMDDRGAIEHLYRVAGKELDEPTYRRFLESKSRRVIELARSGKHGPLPGVAELLRDIHGRCGVGICSGALRREIDVMLQGLGVQEFFGVITSAEDVDVGKPDPRGYILTAQRLSEKIGRPLPRSDCLVIEDAPSVALRASEAGFAVLGVETTYAAGDWPAGIVTVPSLLPRELRDRVPRLFIQARKS